MRITAALDISIIKIENDLILNSPDFMEWIHHKALEKGTGTQSETYCNNEDIGDIDVLFEVTLVSIKSLDREDDYGIIRTCVNDEIPCEQCCVADVTLNEAICNYCEKNNAHAEFYVKLKSE